MELTDAGCVDLNTEDNDSVTAWWMAVDGVKVWRVDEEYTHVDIDSQAASVCHTQNHHQQQQRAMQHLNLISSLLADDVISNAAAGVADGDVDEITRARAYVVPLPASAVRRSVGRTQLTVLSRTL